jgi:hypothetical protein
MKMSNSWKHGVAMSEENEIKTVMSCRDVARLVGLSRQRFRQLVISGVFAEPLYDVKSRRPYYTEVMAIQCQEVRRTNMGINGQQTLFYTRRQPIYSPVAKEPRVKTSKLKEGQHADLIEGVRALGMPSINATQVDAALKILYPNGATKVDRGGVLRAVFLHLQRKDE